MDSKEKRIEIFEDTEKMIADSETLMGAVSKSIDHTRVYVTMTKNHEPKYKIPCEVAVSKKRSFAAAEAYQKEHPENKIAVLNFASATNPGGGVKTGSSAQEEALCRCSTLYPVLKTNMLYEAFYNYHRSADNVLYTDTCIYTPDIVVFKSDASEPAAKDEKNWFQTDVITCAAPNLRPVPYNKMNPGKGEVAKISQKDLLALLKKRTEQILNTASLNDADAVILGAFGCGAFCNPPEIVARAFKESLENYKYCFKYVEFAVYCKATETTNYDVFNRKFAGYSK